MTLEEMVDEITPRRLSDSTHPIADTIRDTVVGGRPSASVTLPDAGYIVGDVIGRGGMGEVIAARDQRIGRDVAVKRMVGVTTDSESITRFLREARIQARLDHPAIVPVYELGTNADGAPYFTMKRLTGVTLSDQLAQPGPQQPLLRAFIDVCLAIDLAHSRGIVHRDLKPANIMLGNYGEVYVLDWGIARVLDEQIGRASTAPQDDVVLASRDIETLDDGTRPGALLGTPGYMSPELLEGDPARTPADIYALGSILFEILAGESLHPRGSDAIVHTIASPQVSPSARRPDRAIPPELDALCHAALAEEPTHRPTARALADRVQSYLDGDRDHTRRRALASDELRAAREDLAADDRAGAIRHAGRALALDPESDAAALLTSLVVEPPAQIPAELQASLDGEEREATGSRARRGTLAYLSVFAFWAVVPLLEVRSWSWLLAFNATLAVLAVFGWRASKRGRLVVPYAMLGNLVLGVLMTRIASPFLLTPLMICGALLAFSADRWTIKRPWTLLVWVVVTVMMPFVLEWTGVFEATWAVVSEGFVARSAIYEMPGTVAAVALVAANLIFICVLGLYALGINRTAQAAARSLHIQAWHLKQLLPKRV